MGGLLLFNIPLLRISVWFVPHWTRTHLSVSFSSGCYAWHSCALSLSFNIWSLEKTLRGGKRQKTSIFCSTGGSRKQTTETEQINITEREQQKSCTRLMWRETTAGPKPRWKPVPRGVFNKQNIWFNAPRPTVPICVFTITIESQCKPALKRNYFLSFEESLCMWCVSKVQAVEWRSPLILLG